MARNPLHVILLQKLVDYANVFKWDVVFSVAESPIAITMDRRRGSRGGSRGRGGRRDDTRSIVTTKLFVGNLPADITSEELRGYFEKYGSVTECDVVNEDFGFVHFSTPEEADEAVDAMNGQDVHGSRLRVQKSTSSKRTGGSGGGGGGGRGEGCFKCGESGHWSKECPSENGYGRDRGSSRGGGAYADPYDNPLIERYRRTIDLLHERIRYLEDLLATRPPADPYTRPPADYYDRRSTVAATAYEETTAGYEARSGGGKVSSAYLTDSPPYRSRPY